MTFIDRATTTDLDEAVPRVFVDRERLAGVVQRVTGRLDAVLDAVWARPASHRVGNMTTLALTHVSGRLADGTSWRVFAKTLRPVWQSPQWGMVPPFAQEEEGMPPADPGNPDRPDTPQDDDVFEIREPETPPERLVPELALPHRR